MLLAKSNIVTCVFALVETLLRGEVCIFTDSTDIMRCHLRWHAPSEGILFCDTSTGVRCDRKEPRRSSEYLEKQFRGEQLFRPGKGCFSFIWLVSIGLFVIVQVMMHVMHRQARGQYPVPWLVTPSHTGRRSYSTGCRFF